VTESLLLHNAGCVVSGTLDRPLLDADAVLCVEGRIAAVGRLDDVHPGGVVDALDVGGATLAPGLIDPHTHPVVGDFTPRMRALDWVQAYLNGGVTTLISAGEAHWPGRPRSAAGVKAMAIASHESARNARPGGAKLHAGALLLEPGLTESDFDELAAAGVRLLGEIGLGSIHRPADVAPFVDMARARDFIVPIHVGGASIPGSSVIGAEHVLAIRPDVASHCNGGPTAAPLEDIFTIAREADAAIEVVQAGNIAALVDIVRFLREEDMVDRLQIGSDTPSGTGVVPLAILRTLAYCAGLAGLAPEAAIAAATGQTARRYRLDTGLLAVGAAADVVVLDAPVGSCADDALDALRRGDTPGVGAVVVDGRVLVERSTVTPPPRRPVRRSTLDTETA
jgi:enamidase